MNIEILAENLVSWIKDRVVEAGCRGTILGLSGGIDSAVLAVLCRRAFPEDTLGVIMPCHSHEQDRTDALKVAGRFSIPAIEVVLDGIYDLMLGSLPDFGPEAAISGLARANLKARLRMLTLYFIGNQKKYMVAGSSNRSEISIGYFTKHGDSGVDMMPLGNLVKRQITELAEFLGIPREIIDKPPSAGLWEGQTDEEEMGFSYEVLDRYLLTGEAPAELKSRIDTMMAASLHKRSMPPIARF